MKFFTDEFMCDGMAEQMGCLDLKASAKLWFEHLTRQAAPAPETAAPETRASSSGALTEANVEAHDFRIEFAHETLQSFKDRKEQRDRSRSPRRPDEVGKLKQTIAAMEQTIRVKDSIIALKQNVIDAILAMIRNH